MKKAGRIPALLIENGKSAMRRFHRNDRLVEADAVKAMFFL
jgi:hypothetical protein